MENKQEHIDRINGTLETISIINSFTNDGKTYYIALLDKINGDYTDTLRKHFQVKKWTFEFKKTDSKWSDILKNDLLFYFGQYILKAKEPYLAKEYKGLKNEEFESKNKELILSSETNIEFLLSAFLENISKLIGKDFTFYKLKVDWNSNYEVFYECYVNDYLFDLGNQILLLHFGGSD